MLQSGGDAAISVVQNAVSRRGPRGALPICWLHLRLVSMRRRFLSPNRRRVLRSTSLLDLGAKMLSSSSCSAVSASGRRTWCAASVACYVWALACVSLSESDFLFVSAGWIDSSSLGSVLRAYRGGGDLACTRGISPCRSEGSECRPSATLFSHQGQLSLSCPPAFNPTCSAAGPNLAEILRRAQPEVVRAAHLQTRRGARLWNHNPRAGLAQHACPDQLLSCSRSCCATSMVATVLTHLRWPFSPFALNRSEQLRLSWLHWPGDSTASLVSGTQHRRATVKEASHQRHDSPAAPPGCVETFARVLLASKLIRRIVGRT